MCCVCMMQLCRRSSLRISEPSSLLYYHCASPFVATYVVFLFEKCIVDVCGEQRYFRSDENLERTLVSASNCLQHFRHVKPGSDSQMSCLNDQLLR